MARLVSDSETFVLASGAAMIHIKFSLLWYGNWQICPLLFAITDGGVHVLLVSTPALKKPY